MHKLCSIFRASRSFARTGFGISWNQKNKKTEKHITSSQRVIEKLRKLLYREEIKFSLMEFVIQYDDMSS